MKTYTYQEAYDASLKYFDGDELAARVWVSKYALKDSFGNLPVLILISPSPKMKVLTESEFQGTNSGRL